MFFKKNYLRFSENQEAELFSPQCSKFLKMMFNKNSYSYDKNLKEKSDVPVQHFRKLNVD